MFAQTVTARCRVEYSLHLHYSVLQRVIWAVVRSLPRNVRYVDECLASFHLECVKCMVFFFNEKKELRPLLVHVRGYESTFTITRLGGGGLS